MIVICIRTPEVAELARWTSAAFTWATGLAVRFVDSGIQPHEQKLSVYDEGQYLLLDADIVFVRRWRPPAVSRGTFAGARAQLRPRDIGDAVKRYGVDPAQYLNTGLFIADGTHAPVFARARDLYPHGWRDQDETPINVALQEQRVTTLELQKVNWQLGYKPGVAAVHPVMIRGAERKLAEAKRIWWHFAPESLKEHFSARGMMLGAQPRVLQA